MKYLLLFAALCWPARADQATSIDDNFPMPKDCVFAMKSFAGEITCTLTLVEWEKELGNFKKPKPVKADDAFERLADESAKKTDAEFCEKATEAWQIKAFCKSKPMTTRWFKIKTAGGSDFFRCMVDSVSSKDSLSDILCFNLKDAPQEIELGIRSDGVVIGR